MKRLALLLCLIAMPAVADDVSEFTGNVAVSSATPTLVPPSATKCRTCKTMRIQNGGANTIYCDRSASVTTGTGTFTVSPTEGWVSVPYRLDWYCIAATADQTGADRSRTYFIVVQD